MQIELWGTAHLALSSKYSLSLTFLQASVAETGEVVAIKKVYQDKRYKNRELQIMKELYHPNVITLKHAFYTQGDKVTEFHNYA